MSGEYRVFHNRAKAKNCFITSYRNDRPGSEIDSRLLSTLEASWDCTIMSADTVPGFPSALDTREDHRRAVAMAQAHMRNEHREGRP